MRIEIGLLAAAAFAASSEIREGGLAVRLDHGDGPGPVRVAFHVTGARDGQPVTGLRVRGWMSPRLSAMVSAETTCEQKIRTHLAGGLAQRAEGDLNSFRVVTLNHDRSVLFINPQVAFSRSKLEQIVALPGDPSDWALSPDQTRIAVSMPAESAVAIIDARAARLERVTAVGGRPSRIVFAGGLAWTAFDGGSEAVAIDVASGAIARRIEIGAGLHQIAASDDGASVAITSSEAGTVTLNGRQLAAGSKPLAITYSKAAGAYYVASAGSGEIWAADPETGSITLAARTAPGVLHLRAEPNGRFVAGLNARTNEAVILDTSDHSLRAVALGAAEPDQVVFTRRYAYVRFVGSEQIALLDRDDFRTATPRVTWIAAGRRRPAEEAARIGPSDMIASLPDGDAAMIANGPDKLLYFYREGLIAASGTIQNYSRVPRGVLVVDNKLRETAPGVYETTAALSGGAYDVPFLIDQPRVMACFTASVRGQPERRDGPVSRARFRLSEPVTVRDGRAVLRFQALEAAPRSVAITVVEPPGLWQGRATASASEGRYEATVEVPRAGFYQVLVQAPGEPRRLLGDFRVEAAP